jgi:hypothetical protein
MPEQAENYMLRRFAAGRLGRVDTLVLCLKINEKLDFHSLKFKSSEYNTVWLPKCEFDPESNPRKGFFRHVEAHESAYDSKPAE